MVEVENEPELYKDEVREVDPYHDVPRVRRKHEVYRYDNRPLYAIVSPTIKTIFTDWFFPPFEMQHDKICGRIERNFFKCMETYGSNRGFTECRDFIDDYRECTSYDKQRARVDAIARERRRRVGNGETNVRSPPPRSGSYLSSEY